MRMDLLEDLFDESMHRKMVASRSARLEREEIRALARLSKRLGRGGFNP